MQNTLEIHRTIGNSLSISQWVSSFLTDRKALALTSGTLSFYQFKLKLFVDFCSAENVSDVLELTPDHLRRFLLHLEETKHNSGGIHSAYRAMRAFLKWFEAETEPANWKNPIKKVKAPKLIQPLLDPVDLETVNTLVSHCESDTFLGARDKAMFLCLLDTGCRAREFLALDFSDVNLDSGIVLVRMGKGRKSRTVFLGQKSRRALRSYLRFHPSRVGAIWVTRSGYRLDYQALRMMLMRRSKRAGIPVPTLHSFRRSFALNALRAGMDIMSLQMLLGHSDIQVLRRYLKQTDEDLQTAHRLASPVDRM